ncbi:hypothetical protein TVWG_00007 [Tetraselmis viridis virus N1]|nr:hypothetical protein TVWG_00007 [Tetraselmis viridis virus N1]
MPYFEDPAISEVTWEDVTDKPVTFPPDVHSHDYLPLSGGDIDNGGQIRVTQSTVPEDNTYPSQFELISRRVGDSRYLLKRRRARGSGPIRLRDNRLRGREFRAHRTHTRWTGRPGGTTGTYRPRGTHRTYGARGTYRAYGGQRDLPDLRDQRDRRGLKEIKATRETQLL